MGTLDFIKQFCLATNNEYLRHCMELLDSYVEMHSAANITVTIHDSFVDVYDGDVLLLKISMTMFSKKNVV